MTKLCVCGCEVELVGRQVKYSSKECERKVNREMWLMKVYGITLEEYDTILAYQGGVCAICKQPPKANDVLHVDHEHQGSPSGPLRGLLCGYCNTRILGRLRSAAKALALAEYLTTPPAKGALGREVISPGRPRKKRRRKKKEEE